MNLPTEEDIARLQTAENEALKAAQDEMQSFQRFMDTMSPEARASMDPSNPEVQAYVEARDKASAARVRYETIRSERASAEPMIRYQLFMQNQRDGVELISLIQARAEMSKMNYMNALLGEYEAMSMLMLQGPEVLEQYDKAREQVIKWRGEYEQAQKILKDQPDGLLNPMAMHPFTPMSPKPTLEDFHPEKPEDEEE